MLLIAYWHPRHIVKSAGSTGAAEVLLELLDCCAFATAFAIIASIAASFSSRLISSLMIVFAFTLMFVDPLYFVVLMFKYYTPHIAHV